MARHDMVIATDLDGVGDKPPTQVSRLMNKRHSPRPVAHTREPVGGYRQISTVQVCAVWSAYRQGLLRKYSTVRAYLALLEVSERREAETRQRAQRVDPARRYAVDRPRVIAEVAQLMKTPSVEMARKAIGSLERAGLVQLGEDGAVFVAEVAKLPDDLQSAAAAMLHRIDERENVRERKLRFPRRMLRYLAGCPRPAMAATAFGHAFRCLWTEGAQIRFEGSCSAVFVSETFDIHLRTAKSARVVLREIGWLAEIKADAWHVRRNGARMRVNSAWLAPKAVDKSIRRSATDGTDSPPDQPSTGTESPPAYTKQRTSSRIQKPEPAARRPIGAKGRPSDRDAAHLRNLRPGDLEDAQRLEQIRVECVQRGLINTGEADRLNLFAAACRARRVATVNACGMFRAIVERRCWSHISQADEDLARAMLRPAPEDAAGLLNAIRWPTSSAALTERRANRLADRGACRLARTPPRDGLPAMPDRRSVA
jgi:hypothetical protein